MSLISLEYVDKLYIDLINSEKDKCESSWFLDVEHCGMIVTLSIDHSTRKMIVRREEDGLYTYYRVYLLPLRHTYYFCDKNELSIEIRLYGGDKFKFKFTYDVDFWRAIVCFNYATNRKTTKTTGLIGLENIPEPYFNYVNDFLKKFHIMIYLSDVTCNGRKSTIDIWLTNQAVTVHDVEQFTNTMYPLPTNRLSYICDKGELSIKYALREIELEFKFSSDLHYWTAMAYFNNIVNKASSIDDSIECNVKREHQVTEENVSAISELNSLIGLESLKMDVQNLINFVKMQRIREEKGLKAVPVSLHLVFTGNPGTGKTTVARILAKLYKEIGVLEKGQLVEVDRAGLVAGYIGHTALKTQEKIDEAQGGILFIDEAYTLVKEGNDFGQEAIDTILKAMEDKRNSFIVVVAGYQDQMEKFINSNPGLKSRFSKYFFFPDYNAAELESIFESMCIKYDYRLTDEATEKVSDHIEKMVREKGKNFANARDVRNYFESIITKQASRVANMANPTANDVSIITYADVDF